MFDLSFEKIFVLLVVALFVLGPERLPAAAAWVGKTLRQIRAFAADANEQLHREVGPELEQLRQPLADLRAPLAELRALGDPRRAVLRHFLSDPAPMSSPSVSSVDNAASPRDESLVAGPPPVDTDAT